MNSQKRLPHPYWLKKRALQIRIRKRENFPVKMSERNSTTKSNKENGKGKHFFFIDLENEKGSMKQFQFD